MENTNTNTNTNANANANALTAEQLEMLGLTQEMYNALPEATRIVLLKGLKPARQPKAPVDLWSNAQLLVYGNDHSKAMVALALLLREGVKEPEITQQQWTRATLALIIAVRAYRPEGKLACAEASTRTAVGQARRWREIIDREQLQDKTKRVQLDSFERAMFDHYKTRSLWPGKKDDADKRMSVMAADLLRAEWKKHWTEDNNWRPCKEDQPAEYDNESGDN